MKTIFFTISLCFLASIANLKAQNNREPVKNFISKLIIELNSIKKKEIDDDDLYVEIAKTPSYYDIETIIVKVKSFVNQHPDVSIISPWEKDNDKYICVIKVVDKNLFVQFYPEKEILQLGFLKKY